MSAINKLDTFITNKEYRLRELELPAYWTTGVDEAQYSEISIDASDLLDGDTPPYYYLSHFKSRLLLAWLFDPKQNNLKDCRDYANSFMAELLAKHIPELPGIKQVSSVFYAVDTYHDVVSGNNYKHEFLPGCCCSVSVSQNLIA